jgi:hypothetical protein
MTTYLPAAFEQLKQCLLEHIGIAQVAAADCAYISAAIYKKIKKQLSETTVKRVYGFASYEFKPSAFTLNAMAEFCGYNNWNDYCVHYQKDTYRSAPVEDKDWIKVLEKAEKVTNYTLKVTKNRSGIPYDLTVERKAIIQHLNLFASSAYTATALIAPTGYGKTIGLCHWIDQYLIPKQAAKQDIVLFFSGHALVSAYNSGHELNNWLMSILGIYSDQSIADLLNPKTEFKGRFFLIVDGLDEYLYKDNHFLIIFNQLLDIISLHHQCSWFKVIVTMRSASWINHSHLMPDERQWFTGFITNDYNPVNVPLFNSEEITVLCKKLGATKVGNLPLHIIENFSYPLYFQYYFKTRAGSFSINNFNQVSIYEIVSAYVLNKIYRSRYSDDIIQFIIELISEMNFKANDFKVQKSKLDKLLKTYNHAFKYLIDIGVMQVINVSEHTNYLNYVRFSNKNLLEYAIAKRLLLETDGCFNHELIVHMDALLGNSVIKIPVLKWCLYHAIRNGLTYNLAALDNLSVTMAQKQELAVLVSEILNKQYILSRSPDKTEEDDFNLDENIINYFAGIEFISGNYENALDTILSFKLAPSERILFKCCICISAIIRLDIEKFEQHLYELKQYSNEYFTGFPINPLTCLDFIYCYFKYGIFKRETLVELTRFYFNPQKAPSQGTSKFNEIIYLLAIHCLSICQNPVKTLRLINAIRKIYPNGSEGYNFMIKIISAQAYLQLNDSNKALEIFSGLSAVYPHEETGYTAIIKIGYHMLRLKLISYLQQDHNLTDEAKTLIQLSEDSNFKLTKVNTLAFILSKQELFKQEKSAFNQFYYDFMKTIRSAGCRSESFIKPEVLEHINI